MSISRDQSSDPSTPSTDAAKGVPKTPEEIDDLIKMRPPVWEFLLFGGVLWQGAERLSLAWRDHQLELPIADYRRLNDDEVAGFLSEAFGRLSWIIAPLQRVFAAHEDAFGKPGESGDEKLIRHFAEWLISVYSQLLDWAGMVRSADPPEGFEKAIELSAHAADMPIDQIRKFITNTVEQLERIPENFARPEEEREKDPLNLDMTLTLSADEALMDEAVTELRSALELR